MITRYDQSACARSAMAVLILLLLIQPIIGQTSTRPHSLHIRLQLQHRDGQPVTFLKQKDFVASQRDQVFPLAVIRPTLGNKVPQGRYVPTRMLVILGPLGADSADPFPSLLAALRPVWSRRWQVAVARSEGTVTNYATTEAQLEQMWKAPVMSALKAEAAVVNLKSFMGRRIVMYLTGFPKETTPAPKWLSEQDTEATVQTFVIDGGVANPPIALPTVTAPTKEERAAMDANVYSTDERSPSTPLEGWGRTREFESGVYHEVNVRKAVQDAMHLALGYYDLRISFQSTRPISSDTTLLLTIDGPSDMQVTAQTYGRDNLPPLKIARK